MSGLQGNGVASSFEALINADRKKKKNQELAQSLLGSGRRSSAPGATSIRKAGTGGSLASRVGVHKRAQPPAPRPNINSQWTHDLHKAQNIKRTASTSRIERGERLGNALQRDAAVNGANPQFNIRSASSAQLSIKGKAYPGPFCIIANNFAQGTTSDDIKMAFEPHGHDLLSCKIISDRPDVTAEVVFVKKESAENIVNVFNDSMADGNRLYVYLKPGPPSPVHDLDLTSKTTRTRTPVRTPPPATSSSMHSENDQDRPKPDEATPLAASKDDAMMDVDDTSHSRREDAPREEGRLDRDGYGRGSSSRYQSNGYEDGRYGFSNSYDRRPRQDYRPSYGARPRYDDRAWQGGRGWR